MNKFKSAMNVRFLLLVLLATSSLHVFGQWSQTKKVAAPDRFSWATFGRNVSISNNYAVVSSDVSSLSLFSSGGYYLYELKNGTWQLNRRLIWSDKKYRLGARGVEIKDSLMIVSGVKSICLDSNGVQVPFCAAYFVYRLKNGDWIEDGVLELPYINNADGTSVSISGNYAIGGQFYQDVIDTASGDTVVEAGVAYVYQYANGSWNLQTMLHASDPYPSAWFGGDVSIDGYTAVVGAPRRDRPDSENNYNYFEAGAAYVFELENSKWVEKARFQPDDITDGYNFGTSVSISNNVILIGAPFYSPIVNGTPLFAAGATYVYERAAGSWQQIQQISATDVEEASYFGYAVSLHNNVAIVGAHGTSTDTAGLNPMIGTGAAYILLNSSGIWFEQSKIVAQDRDVEDFFGVDVAISNNKALVGAYLDDENATGQNPITFAGSAYFFEGPAYVDINENIDSPNQIKVYPNPANEMVTLEFGNAFTGTFQLLDVHGRVLYKESIDFQQANGKTVLNIAHLPSGIYFVKLYNNQEIIIQRFQKVD